MVIKQKNIAYISTYIDKQLSKELSLDFSQAGLDKKNAALQLFHKENRVSAFFICLQQKIPGGYIRSSETEILGGITLFFPSFFTTPILTYLLNPLLSAACVIKAHRHQEFDVIIIYNLTFETVCTALFVKIFTKLPIVVQMEDGINAQFGTLKKTIGRISEWLGRRLVVGALVNSTNFQVLFDSKPTLLFRGVFNGEQTSPEQSPERIERGNLIKISFASSLDSVRGAELLIDFLNSVKSEKIVQSVEFCIFGKGNPEILSRLSEAIDGYCSKGGRATHFGFVASEVLTEHLITSSAFLCIQDPNSSFSEFCFPSKVFDLYRYSKPIISTKVSDLSNDPFFSNLIFIDYSLQGLAKALTELIDNYDILLAQNYDNCSRMKQKFGANKLAKELEMFLEKLQ